MTIQHRQTPKGRPAPPVRLWLLTGVLILLALAPAPLQGETGCPAQPEPRYFTWTPSTSQPLDDAAERTGDFRVTIEREYASEAEERLLALVEATYPLYPDSILLTGFSRPTDGDAPRWWTSEVDGFRIPVAVTRAAVDYYLALVRSLQAGKTTGGGEIRQRTADLEYTASIQPAASALEGATEHPRDLDGKYVVRLEMSWESDCGPRCGLRFTRTRTAVVSADGQVLEVLEDPLAPVVVD